MTRYLSKRLVFLAATLAVASVAVFALIEVIPGTPAQVILGTQATPAAVAALTVRVVGVLESDYLRTARAKGRRPGQALVRHGLRNAAVPVLTVLGLELAGLVVGAVVVETVFTLPGVGTLLVQAIDNRDLIVVQDIVMLVAGTVLVVNLLVDLSYRLVDPRIDSRT